MNFSRTLGERLPGKDLVFLFSLGLGGIVGYRLPGANSWISLLLSVILQLSLDLSSNG
ncbi:uncharacterized protein METZ01_LOCUS154524 [marine metagenome]|uniref:Uncharacterized protein n=1 Tax=marine metagenome TaxID=408172 RepID=A0A382AJC4_9ZZZZ